MADFGQVDDDDAEEAPTEERAAHLETVAARVRERLGEQEWRRLSGLLVIARVATGGRRLALLVAALVGLPLAVFGAAALLQRLLSAHWGLPTDKLGEGLAEVAVAVGVGAVFLLVDYLAETSLRRALEQHGEQAKDRDGVYQALWASSEIRQIRRTLAKQAREAAAEARLPQELHSAPPRWRTELSGAYLVWWLCAAFWLAWLIFHWPLPDRLLESIGVITLCGLLFRLLLLAVLRGPYQEPSDRLGILRFSWWWGRGWLPVVVALLPGVAYWVVARLDGWP